MAKKIPSQKLRYELSVWSDLAKRCMLEQEFHAFPKITFDTIAKIPDTIFIVLPTISIQVSLNVLIWPTLIPSLLEYPDAITVYRFPGFTIKRMLYKPTDKKIIIEKENLPAFETALIPITTDWSFIPNNGFIAVKPNTLFQKSELTNGDIVILFNKYLPLFAKYLEDETLHIGIFPLQYNIYFDAQKHLHIDTYLFIKGDLSEPNSGFFPPWVYINGWYRVSGEMKKQKLLLTSSSHITEFIQANSHWLTTFPGFVIHKMPMPFQPLLYVVEKEGLKFYDQKKNMIQINILI